MSSAGAGTHPHQAPTVLRRLACFLYEGVLLFGVVMLAGYLYSSLTQQRHALQGQWGLQAFLFLVIGIYFVWFWNRGGQTVAMKTWHIKLVCANGGRVSQPRAMARYLLSWIWFVPALVTVDLSGLKGGWPLALAATAGVLAYAMLAHLHPAGQFWHDAICRTNLIDCRPSRAQAPGG